MPIKNKALFKTPVLRTRNGNAAVKNTRKKTLIVCEGSVTEPTYFRDMIKDLKISNMDVVIEPGRHSDPVSVVQTAIDKYEETRDFEVIYCLIDTDEFGSKIKDAEKLLKNHNFSRRKKDAVGDRYPTAKILRSNPCIEVWFLLHFENLRRTFVKNKDTASVNCKKYLRDNHILGYCERYQKLYDLLRKDGKVALLNSKSLHRWIKESGAKNPWTEADELYADLQGLSYKDTKDA